MKLKALKVEDCSDRQRWRKGTKALPQDPE